jgi:transposase
MFCLNQKDSLFGGFVIQATCWIWRPASMTRPYSTDLRERAVCAVIAGETTRVVADRFGIAVSSVVKWHQRFRQTGTVAPGQMGGHRKRILEPHRDFIIQEINRTPHLTVRGLKAILAEQGITASHHAVWTFLRREGLSFKKNTVRP